MKTLFVALLMLGSAACHAAETWKWVDEKGVTQYGDTPPPSATVRTPVDTRPYGVIDGGVYVPPQRERADGGQPGAAPDSQVAQSNARGMDYNTYIRLSAGMDEGELLSRAGPPDNQSVENFKDYIIKSYYYMPTLADPYITTVKLQGGKITSIARTKRN